MPDGSKVAPPVIEAGSRTTVRLTVNGMEMAAEAEPRLLLSDFLRHRLRLTGTHVGCEHGVCGACTVLLDGEPVRSCLCFAVQADGAEVVTVEGLAARDAPLHPIQQAFHEAHGMQCGFCTPGFLISLLGLLNAAPDPSEDELLDSLSGNLCRCTGYANILSAARLAQERLRADRAQDRPA
jgi:aerobic-type carbon monoxide dehydrogenase small subunit (CoxS/CutS family)